jgi:hypothetical protein
LGVAGSNTLELLSSQYDNTASMIELQAKRHLNITAVKGVVESHYPIRVCVNNTEDNDDDVKVLFHVSGSGLGFIPIVICGLTSHAVSSGEGLWIKKVGEGETQFSMLDQSYYQDKDFYQTNYDTTTETFEIIYNIELLYSDSTYIGFGSYLSGASNSGGDASNTSSGAIPVYAEVGVAAIVLVLFATFFYCCKPRSKLAQDTRRDNNYDDTTVFPESNNKSRGGGVKQNSVHVTVNQTHKREDKVDLESGPTLTSSSSASSASSSSPRTKELVKRTTSDEPIVLSDDFLFESMTNNSLPSRDRSTLKKPTKLVPLPPPLLPINSTTSPATFVESRVSSSPTRDVVIPFPSVTMNVSEALSVDETSAALNMISEPFPVIVRDQEHNDVVVRSPARYEENCNRERTDISPEKGEKVVRSTGSRHDQSQEEHHDSESNEPTISPTNHAASVIRRKKVVRSTESHDQGQEEHHDSESNEATVSPTNHAASVIPKKKVVRSTESRHKVTKHLPKTMTRHNDTDDKVEML